MTQSFNRHEKFYQFRVSRNTMGANIHEKNLEAYLYKCTPSLLSNALFYLSTIVRTLTYDFVQTNIVYR